MPNFVLFHIFPSNADHFLPAPSSACKLSQILDAWAFKSSLCVSVRCCVCAFSLRFVFLFPSLDYSVKVSGKSMKCLRLSVRIHTFRIPLSADYFGDQFGWLGVFVQFTPHSARIRANEVSVLKKCVNRSWSHQLKAVIEWNGRGNVFFFLDAETLSWGDYFEPMPCLNLAKNGKSLLLELAAKWLSRTCWQTFYLMPVALHRDEETNTATIITDHHQAPQTRYSLSRTKFHSSKTVFVADPYPNWARTVYAHPPQIGLVLKIRWSIAGHFMIVTAAHVESSRTNKCSCHRNMLTRVFPTTSFTSNRPTLKSTAWKCFWIGKCFALLLKKLSKIVEMQQLPCICMHRSHEQDWMHICTLPEMTTSSCCSNTRANKSNRRRCESLCVCARARCD